MGTYTGSDKRLQYLFQNGGGGGASALSDLSDVDLTNLANNQIIKYNSTTQKWQNANESGGGSANIWTGTKAEYEAQASQIEDGTQVNITDDEENVKALDIYPADANPIVIGKYGNRDIKRKRIYLATLATGSNAITTQLPTFDILIGFHGYCKTNETTPRYMQIGSDINTSGWYCGVLLYGNYQGNPLGHIWCGSPFNGGSAEIWIDYVEALS